MSSKMDTDGKGYVRDDTIDTTLNKMLLGTDYHGEATAVASTYSSGTCQVALGAACKHLMFLVEGTDDIVYCVMDSSDAAGALTGTTRYKFKGATNGSVTSVSLGTAVTTLDFAKRNSGSTIAVYVDGFS